MDNELYVCKNIKVTNKNIKSIIESDEFSLEDKLNLISVATEVIDRIIEGN